MRTPSCWWSDPGMMPTTGSTRTSTWSSHPVATQRGAGTGRKTVRPTERSELHPEDVSQALQQLLLCARAAQTNANRGGHAVPPWPPEAVSEERAPDGGARQDHLTRPEPAGSLGELAQVRGRLLNRRRRPFAREREGRNRARLAFELGTERRRHARNTRVPAPTVRRPGSANLLHSPEEQRPRVSSAASSRHLAD